MLGPKAYLVAIAAKKLGFPPRDSPTRARPSVTRASCTRTLTAPVAASADRRCVRSGIAPAGPAKDCLCALSTSLFPQKAGWLASVFLGAAPAAFQSRTDDFLARPQGPAQFPWDHLPVLHSAFCLVPFALLDFEDIFYTARLRQRN